MMWERIILTSLWFIAVIFAAGNVGAAVGRGEMRAASGVALIAVFYQAVWLIT